MRVPRSQLHRCQSRSPQPVSTSSRKVLADIHTAGLLTVVFFGRPDYHGAGGAGDVWDPVGTPAAQAYLLARVGEVLGRPALQAGVAGGRVVAASVYWLGAACHHSGQCTDAAVTALTVALRAAANAAGLPYLQVPCHSSPTLRRFLNPVLPGKVARKSFRRHVGYAFTHPSLANPHHFFLVD